MTPCRCHRNWTFPALQLTLRRQRLLVDWDSQLLAQLEKRKASCKARLKPWLLTNRLQMLRIPVYLTVWLPNACRYIHLPDGGDHREYSCWLQSQALRIQKKTKGKISACLYIGDPQQSLSKQMPAWWKPLTSQSVRPVWTSGYASVLLHSFSSLWQRQKTKTNSDHLWEEKAQCQSHYVQGTNSESIFSR